MKSQEQNYEEHLELLKQAYPIQLGAHNPILRAKAVKVDKITPDIRNFCHALMELMRANEGVGLAAPQVGVSKRIIATSQWKKDKKGNLQNTAEDIMINPEIISKSEKMIREKEACLSLPKAEGTVIRHAEIKVSYQDLQGKIKTKKLTGFDSVIVQHEIDHLDGVLFIDKMVE